MVLKVLKFSWDVLKLKLEVLKILGFAIVLEGPVALRGRSLHSVRSE